jgi:putative ABC transport system permease protein
MMTGPEDAPARGERLFRLFLLLYPRPFRERFGDELIRFFRLERMRPRFTGRWGAWLFWGHTLSDLVRTAVVERRRSDLGLATEVDMHTLAMDVRFAIRTLFKNARVTVLAVVTLALGIGASTAILSVTKGVLLDPLPYRDPDRLALIWAEMPRSGFVRYPISGPELGDLRSRSKSFEEFASIWTTTGALVEENEPETVRLALVTWNFPSVLGAEPVIGRSFEPDEEGLAAGQPVLVSEQLWRRRFGGEKSVLGKSIRIDGGWGFPGGTFTVAGVLPASFRLVLPTDAGVATDPDVWVPFRGNLAAAPRTLYYLRTVGRMRAGANLEEAREEIRAIGEQIQSEFSEYAATGRAFNVVSLKGDAVSRARPVILALLVGTGFLLLITCANVANLLLARAAQRQEEILLRTALGASKRQITLQLLIESLVLATFGGLGGLALGAFCLGPLLALAPGSLPRPEAIVADPLVLALAFGTSLVCGILFGLAPVVTARRQQLATALRSSSRGAGGNAGRSVLVVAELALAFVLSVGAFLCFQTLERLERVDLGFDTDGVLTMQLTLPRDRYGTGIQLKNFTRELERRLRQVPGVAAAGAINQLPLSDLPNWSSPYRVRSTEKSEGETNEADGRVVTPGYFATVRARLVDGRWFDGSEDETSRHVVIVDERLASRAWPGQRAVGQELQVQVNQSAGFVTVWAEVVGVVKHMRHHDPRFEVREQFFVPFAQGARNQMAVALRGQGDPLDVLAPVQREIAALDKDLAVSRVRLLEDYARDARAVQRFTMVLAAGFAAMALVLGGLGVYGVVAYAVSSRQREIGLRIALGSTSADIARWVLRRGALLVLAGIGVGFAGALASGRLLEGLLFGVERSDPGTFLLVPVVLSAVAILASWLPARRAMRVDPAVVLRQE